MLRLYSYWRSSAAYRVRIALGLKNLAYESTSVHLVRDGGEQHLGAYRAINPQGLVPALEHDGVLLRQSLAIVEYLDEVFPAPPLLPREPPARARVRSLAQIVACDMHPLNNLRVLEYLRGPLSLDSSDRDAWYAHWIAEGFSAFEALLCADAATGRYCHGDQPGLADLCLIPQVYNARRFGCDLEPYPTVVAIEQACLALPAFDRARPERQPDAG